MFLQMISTRCCFSDLKACDLQARQKIADRGPSIGVDQASEVAKLKAAVPDWEQILCDTQDSSVGYPEYYTKPFHAYDDGNLSWEAAFQVGTNLSISSTCSFPWDLMIYSSLSSALFLKVHLPRRPVLSLAARFSSFHPHSSLRALHAH